MLDDDTRSTTTSEADFGTTWLLLSNGRRVIALSTDLRVPSMTPGFGEDDGSKSNILADYELGGHFGNLTLLEFVFDHRHALLMFEHSASAMLLNLTRPQRDEISHIKHPDSTSFAQAPDTNRFALLRRDKGQDKISVFERSSTGALIRQTFDSHTSDAQGIMWCPGGQPLLAVCDSSTYGVSVLFYTAQGHSLKQLDINSTSMNLVRLPMNVEGVGTTCLKWINTSCGETIQGVLDGQRQLLLRNLVPSSMGARQVALFVHPDTIDGDKTFVWQEEIQKGLTSSFSSIFLRQKASFSAIPESEGPSSHSTNMIEINADQTMIATSLQGFTKMLWIWKPRQSEPHTVIIFRHPVKNVLWHPTMPHVLAVVTNQKRPIVYVWYQPNLGPIRGQITLNHEMHSNQLVSTLSTRFSGSWLPAAKHTDGRVPFFFTSATRFEVSFLQSLNGEVIFESALRRSRDLLEGDESSGFEETVNVHTPSRAVTTLKHAHFAEEAGPRLDGNPSIHAQAKYGRW
ncbi:uncharacterized protein A1O9_07243 [Exophiala aquamarina CBS 119918]|uniref:Uncharacterized protein n=1 Tax=Exophiala aquamarina CBS 119918 TaxID=1182545 RepID=A0A072PCM8_9EURO|nr:uncharacterized protein A1O9_07243 [Exophiala aquamarina CBS 119918]KEF57053.1 hypothetical protein A1O9_07243 [Exophiala aquamarina CBS 119918]